jgi:outer membrane protein TolC
VRAAYTAYWTIKGYELQIAATEEGLALTRQSLDIIQAKADAGLAAGIDVNRSKVDLYSQEDTLVSQRASRYQAAQELLRLLHLDTDEVTLSDEAPAPTAGPVSLPTEPGGDRPELRRKVEEAAQAEAAVRAARAGTLPSVALYGTAGVGGSSVGPTDPDSFGAFDSDTLRPALDASAGLQLSWNPFDLFQTRDAVAEAKLAAQQVDAATESERAGIRAEIRGAASTVAELRERVPLSDSQVALARDNLQIVQGLYAQGSATILDLFDAQSAFRSARTQGATLRVQLATAEYDLRWLTGEDLLGATR